MSAPTLYPTAGAVISADEFHALEENVLRAVEMIRSERDARLAAEAEAKSLREQLNARSADADAELIRLREERDAVRQRVEKMLRQLDELI